MLSPEQLRLDVSTVGYEVRLGDGSVVALRPVYDAVGVGAELGKEVEVSSLGLSRRAVVVRRLGYAWQYTADRLDATDDRRPITL